MISDSSVLLIWQWQGPYDRESRFHAAQSYNLVMIGVTSPSRSLTLAYRVSGSKRVMALLTTPEKRESHTAVGGCFVVARRTYSMLMISQTVAIAA